MVKDNHMYIYIYIPSRSQFIGWYIPLYPDLLNRKPWSSWNELAGRMPSSTSSAPAPCRFRSLDFPAGTVRCPGHIR